MKWLERNWPVTTIFLAVYITMMMVLFLRQDLPLFLIWAQLPVYFLHEFEEYIAPGGFLAWFNHHVLGSSEDGWPLTARGSLWINGLVIFIAFPVGGVLATQLGLGWGLWMAYFSIANSLSHVVMLVIFRSYNPGLAISIVLNIPVGTYTVVYLAMRGLTSVGTNVIALLVGVAIQAVIMIYGFAVLKPRVRAGAHGAAAATGPRRVLE